MHTFLVGLVFLISTSVLMAVLAGMAFLLYPLMLVIGVLFWFGLVLSIGIFCIWAIGKLVLLILEALKKR